jgi:LuxR family maltose regulon positive regulatory protein
LRGAWRAASAAFEQAVAQTGSPAAYEGLGIAARYLGDHAAAVAAHERGYRVARSGTDAEPAARLAVQLALDAYGQARLAEANGWVERAIVLTDGRATSEARALALALRGHVTMSARNDPHQALELAGRALAAARAAGSTDVELVALALEGLALVCVGAIDEGMRRLDLATAAAVAGEVGDVDLAETICCYLIDACKRVRDLERAAEWCVRVAEIATRFEDRFMFAVCRVHHADILVWRGEWEQADHELTAAAGLLGRLGADRSADCLVRLAELRRRQGRRDEAVALLAGCETHRLHALHSGLLALDRGAAGDALDEARRFLRRTGAEDRFARVPGLELLVRAALCAGDMASAATAAGELRAIADCAATGPLHAAALLAEGRVAAAGGECDRARVLLQDAAEAFTAAGAPFEAAHARSKLAETLWALGLREPARVARGRAAAELARLGAAAPDLADRSPLSPREREVLRLVAGGRSNDEIAAALVLSVRTVERHVVNVYAKLGLSGPTARAAATGWAHEHGVA